MAEYLLADIGSTFTKLCLVDTRGPAVCATARAPTTIETDVNEGFEGALASLGRRPRPGAPTLVCSSAAGGLRIAAVGLVPELTVQAARLAALGAGGKVVQALAFELTGDDLTRLQRGRPDLILLTGGTDGGNSDYILRNARLLAEHTPDTPLVVAGNRATYDSLRALFAGRDDVRFVGNVMPALGTLDLEPAREAIRDVFLRRITRAKGIDRIRAQAQVVMPTPLAVVEAAALLSKGLPPEDGWGELVVVDVGGATTDVCSCAVGAPASAGVTLTGLTEPFVKRTVEGDLGVRHTARSLLEEATPAGLAAESGLAAEDVERWVELVAAEPARLPACAAEQALDTALARACCRLAVERHCGRLRTLYTPQGRQYVQEGKDLAGVGWLIGTGGPLAGSPVPATILEGGLRAEGETALKPVSPRLAVDRDYVLWALGLLAQVEPTAASRLLPAQMTPV